MSRRVPPHGVEPRKTKRRRRSRGAVAVEAALVTPIFLMLLVGIVEFGMLFKDWLAVTSSVRAGARLASAEPRIATYAQDAANNVAKEAAALNMGNIKELWVYKADDNGYPIGVGNFSNCVTCYKFSWNSSTRKFEPILSTTWLSTDQYACPSDPSNPNAKPDSIGIYMKISHPAVVKLLFKSIDINEHTVMSLEPIPIQKGCKKA